MKLLLALLLLTGLVTHAVGAEQNGRYILGGEGTLQFVLDTQTGQMFHVIYDEHIKMLKLEQIPYETKDGLTVLAPRPPSK